MKINDHNLGHAHTKLREVAAQMRQDGHDLLALEYGQRAAEAETVFGHLRDLGVQAGEDDIYNPKGSDQRGVEIGNWLLANGWTPPVHIPIKED